VAVLIAGVLHGFWRLIGGGQTVFSRSCLALHSAEIKFKDYTPTNLNCISSEWQESGLSGHTYALRGSASGVVLVFV
jgi:hypothetical protein